MKRLFASLIAVAATTLTRGSTVSTTSISSSNSDGSRQVLTEIAEIIQQQTMLPGMYYSLSFQPETGRLLLTDDDFKVWLTNKDHHLSQSNLNERIDLEYKCENGAMLWTRDSFAICTKTNPELMQLDSDTNTFHLVAKVKEDSEYEVIPWMVMKDRFVAEVINENPSFEFFSNDFKNGWRVANLNGPQVVGDVRSNLCLTVNHVYNFDDEPRAVCSFKQSNNGYIGSKFFNHDQSQFAIYHQRREDIFPLKGSIQWYNVEDCQPISDPIQTDLIIDDFVLLSSELCWINDDILVIQGYVYRKSQNMVLGRYFHHPKSQVICLNTVNDNSHELSNYFLSLDQGIIHQYQVILREIPSDMIMRSVKVSLERQSEIYDRKYSAMSISPDSKSVVLIERITHDVFIAEMDDLNQKIQKTNMICQPSLKWDKPSIYWTDLNHLFCASTLEIFEMNKKTHRWSVISGIDNDDDDDFGSLSMVNVDPTYAHKNIFHGSQNWFTAQDRTGETMLVSNDLTKEQKWPVGYSSSSSSSWFINGDSTSDIVILGSNQYIYDVSSNQIKCKLDLHHHSGSSWIFFNKDHSEFARYKLYPNDQSIQWFSVNTCNSITLETPIIPNNIELDTHRMCWLTDDLMVIGEYIFSKSQNRVIQTLDKSFLGYGYDKSQNDRIVECSSDGSYMLILPLKKTGSLIQYKVTIMHATGMNNIAEYQRQPSMDGSFQNSDSIISTMDVKKHEHDNHEEEDLKSLSSISSISSSASIIEEQTGLDEQKFTSMAAFPEMNTLLLLSKDGRKILKTDSTLLQTPVDTGFECPLSSDSASSLRSSTSSSSTDRDSIDTTPKLTRISENQVSCGTEGSPLFHINPLDTSVEVTESKSDDGESETTILHTPAQQKECNIGDDLRITPKGLQMESDPETIAEFPSHTSIEQIECFRENSRIVTLDSDHHLHSYVVEFEGMGQKGHLPSKIAQRIFRATSDGTFNVNFNDESHHNSLTLIFRE